jgi:hypothetical protein
MEELFPDKSGNGSENENETKFLSYRKRLALNEPERIPEIRSWKKQVNKTKQTKTHEIKEETVMNNNTLKASHADTNHAYAKSIAALRAEIENENVKDALPFKEYSGTVIGYEKGYLMLLNKSSPSEVILFKGCDLHVIPEISESIKIGELGIDSKRKVNSKEKGSITR